MANTSTGANALTFNFSTQALRCIMRDGEPWFVAADVCAAIGISRTDDGMSRLDDDEKDAGSIRTPGGEQEMTIINESGLYSLILGSRKPEAKKFKKWVTSEVLPAIRKTGRYVASNDPQATTPPPASVAEFLSGSDLLNIKRMIWFCTRGFQYESAWNQGVWFYLRRVLGVPSPHQFNVEHLPVLASELHRIHGISHQVQEIIREIETQAIRRIFRKGEAADVVVADLQRLAQANMLEVRDDLSKLPAYWQREHAAITQRAPHLTGTDYGANEQPGYFGETTA